MRNLARVLFIFIVVFLATASFAGLEEQEKAKQEQAEELELHDEILVPFICRFNDSSSTTKCLSLKSIKKQLDHGCRFSTYEAYASVHLSSKEEEKREQIYKVQSATGYRVKDHRNKIEIAGFARSQLMAWQLQALNCGEYSRLVMTTFEFNMINRQLLGKPLNFKNAIIIRAPQEGDNGDHQFVLVEGKSGAIFAVDPWAWSVTRLGPDFINLFDKQKETYDTREIIRLPENLNQQINSLFKVKGLYYDMMYVRPGTRWILEITYSKKIQGFAHEYNEEMKEFYTTLQPKFREWIFKYDDLPLHNRPGTVKPEPDQTSPENTKPDLEQKNSENR